MRFSQPRTRRRQTDLSAPPIKGFKRSAEPILVTDKLRYVGEIVAMCVASTRAEAEDIASTVTLEFEELPAVTECWLRASPVRPSSTRTGETNIRRFREKKGAIEDIADTAEIKVHKTYPNLPPLYVSDGRTRRRSVSRRAASLPDPRYLDAISQLGTDWPL